MASSPFSGVHRPGYPAGRALLRSWPKHFKRAFGKRKLPSRFGGFRLAPQTGTWTDQLAPDVKLKVQRSGATETVQRLHRELAAVQADSKMLDETYAETVLQLAIVKAYVESLLKNARIVRWLARFHRDYLEQLQLIADIKKL